MTASFQSFIITTDLGVDCRFRRATHTHNLEAMCNRAFLFHKALDHRVFLDIPRAALDSRCFGMFRNVPLNASALPHPLFPMDSTHRPDRLRRLLKQLLRVISSFHFLHVLLIKNARRSTFYTPNVPHNRLAMERLSACLPVRRTQTGGTHRQAAELPVRVDAVVSPFFHLPYPAPAGVFSNTFSTSVLVMTVS